MTDINYENIKCTDYERIKKHVRKMVLLLEEIEASKNGSKGQILLLEKSLTEYLKNLTISELVTVNAIKRIGEEYLGVDGIASDGIKMFGCRNADVENVDNEADYIDIDRYLEQFSANEMINEKLKDEIRHIKNRNEGTEDDVKCRYIKEHVLTKINQLKIKRLENGLRTLDKCSVKK